jgi:SAM-dependent methyltransferase
MTDRPAPERRLTFGEVAELYEQVRPSYPQALVEEVVAYAELRPGDRILEVGAGTGKATRLFGGRGQEIVALEPSAGMAAVARATCADFPEVTVIESEFESWSPPQEAFKLLISAQAWHWIDPEVRYARARAALERGGALAAFWNHVDWQSMALKPVLANAYRETAPNFGPSGPMHPLTRHWDLIPDWLRETDAAGGFEQQTVRTFRWHERYRANEYVRLLSTHSDHAVLDPAVQERLFASVADAIEANGDELEVAYVTHLCLGRTV